MEQHLAEIADSDKSDQLQTPLTNTPKAPAVRNESQPRQDMDDKDTPSRSISTPTPVLFHHRRKRSRVSPLNRLSHFNDEPPYPNRTSVPVMDEHHRLGPIKDSSDEPSPDESAENDHALLDLTPLDSEFRDLLNKYVRSNFVQRSLELAGFSSPYVLIRLDEAQLQKLEQFVGHACSSMKSVHMREQFTGPIFARNPTQFKLPSGAVCGILLAAGELKRKYRRSQLISGSIPAPDLDNNLTDDAYDPGLLVEVSCQTDITLPPLGSNNALLNHLSSANDFHANNPTNSSADVDLSPPPLNSGPVFPSDTSTSRTGRTNNSATTANQTTGSPNQSLKLENPVSTTSAGTAAIVAAALQAAAAAATAPNLDGTLFAPHSSESGPTGLDAAAVSFANGLNSAFPSTFPNDLCMGLHNSLNVSTAVVRSATTANNSSMSTSGVNISSNPNNSSNFVMATSASGGFDEELVDLERLKQHSSASAIRLASRQFINAYLMRGRDFDLEMELSITPEGCKRVTGIFYCHLCREKRERTSAVRFSIARNRYPVLSNVLSHLKTHFHYRGSMVSAPHHNNHHQHHQLMHPGKNAPNLNDSFVNTGGNTHSPNSFANPSGANCSGYHTELNLDPLNQFASHHIKPEAMNYAYHRVDSGSADDSNPGHGAGGVYDNLAGSPTRSLNSPIDKCSPQTGSTNHNLRLDTSGPALSDNVKNNASNTLTS